MTDQKPPALATWLLTRAARGNEALIGDLLEEHRRRGSGLWYWRQVLDAVVVNRAGKALVALAVVALYLAAAQFSIPGTKADTLTMVAARAVGVPWWSFNILSGGQLAGFTVFALGIMPYISAALIVQIAAVIWRAMNRNGMGRPRLPIVAWTWGVALALSALQAAGLAVFLERATLANAGLAIVVNPGWAFRITTVFVITSGTACLMAISDQITRRRIGNGMLLVFAAGVVAGLANAASPLLRGEADPFGILKYLVLHAAVAGAVAHFYRREFDRSVSAT